MNLDDFLRSLCKITRDYHNNSHSSRSNPAQCGRGSDDADGLVDSLLPFEVKILECCYMASLSNLEEDMAAIEDKFRVVEQMVHEKRRYQEINMILHHLKQPVVNMSEILKGFTEMMDEYLNDEDSMKLLEFESHMLFYGPETLRIGFEDRTVNRDLENLMEYFDQEVDQMARRSRTLGTSLNELEKHITVALAIKRNEMMRFELICSVLSTAFGAGACLTGIFGMNVVNRFEESHTAFIVISVIALLITCFAVLEQSVPPRDVGTSDNGGLNIRGCDVTTESPKRRLGTVSDATEEASVGGGLSWSQGSLKSTSALISLSDDPTESVGSSIVGSQLSEDADTAVSKPSKKQRRSPKRKVDADEPAVGSLFNRIVKPGDGCADIKSAKFDPSLFDISPYIPQHPPASRQNSLLFIFLAEVLQEVDDTFRSGTGSRKCVSTILSNFFRVLIYHRPNDVMPAVYIMVNRIAPEYEGEEIGVGDVLVIKAMAESYGKSVKSIKEMLTRHEDLGIVASMSSCTSQTIVRLPDLTIEGVFKQFKSIAAESGKNSVERKKNGIKRLLACAKRKEAKYIVRFLQQKLRIGVNSITLFQSIADATYLTKAAKGDQPAIGDTRTAGIKQADTIDEMEKAVKTATTHLACIDTIIGHLMDGDNCEQLLEHCKIRPGIPVGPMLAKPVSKTSEILPAIGGPGVAFTCEYKYDGERIQLHLMKDRTVKIFSRRMENICEKYPDVMESFRICVKPTVIDCIIDLEVVAYDPNSGKIMPFQHLSTRKRKSVMVKDISIPVCMYPFDILYLNGESLVTKPLSERRVALESAVSERKNLLQLACRKDMNSLDEIDDFLRQAVSDSCEGLMIKSLHQDATYEPQVRTNNWLKFKKDYIDGMGDSLDLVPIAAFSGTVSFCVRHFTYMLQGRRTSVYGSFLLAVYDPVHEVYQSACRTGTGFNDQMLADLYEGLQGHIVPHKPAIYDVPASIEPDVWFLPVRVWECKAADFSLSPLHTAGQDFTPFKKVGN
ncbi:DNA ligase [Babesia ovata]|uniref:DNA ligase n=1 Tax=Babesia ovata TaxID=189622 RepID=A0A2H6KHK0_9APIC|nr:DNA ligase [Babesia ovata]GBE62477.1 DNA ligase [Babesia ovata]